MPTSIMWSSILDILSARTGLSLHAARKIRLSGGCIHEAYCVESTDGRVFLKRNHAQHAPMLAAEYEALIAIAKTGTLKVPEPIAWGISGGDAWLATEYLELGPSSETSQELLGYQLAQLHQLPQASFGWHQTNSIGLTEQPNRLSDDWVAFFRDQRLAWQFKLAAQKNHVFDGSQALLESMSFFFEGYVPRPCLLHGDLWHGNAASLHDGTPVVFDPAAYCGDSEAEFGIMELFGGFSPGLREAYSSLLPPSPGHQRRLHLYRLYHELNHLNMFGGGYLAACHKTIAKLLGWLASG